MSDTTPPAGGADTLTPQPTTTSTETTRTFVIGGAENRPADDVSIRPFSYRATDEELTELKRRIRETRWPSRELVNDASQGVQLATIQKLADYWAISMTGGRSGRRFSAIRTSPPVSTASTFTSST